MDEPDAMSLKPDVFTYIDFRLFLKDAFEAVKARAPRLSYRTFAKKAGFSSPNFLQMVIQGKRNLNSTYAVAAAKAFTGCEEPVHVADYGD